MTGTLGILLPLLLSKSSSPGRTIVGIVDRLSPTTMAGIAGSGSPPMQILGMVCAWLGFFGEVAIASARDAIVIEGTIGWGFDPCGFVLSSTATSLETSGLESVACSGAFQFLSKLTMGRPGVSLTADGVGSLLLRSCRRMLVACRISSLRISKPSFLGTSSVFCLFRRSNGLLVVYPALRDCVGGFLCISLLDHSLKADGGADVEVDPVAPLAAIEVAAVALPWFGRRGSTRAVSFRN